MDYQAFAGELGSIFVGMRLIALHCMMVCYFVLRWYGCTNKLMGMDNLRNPLTSIQNQQ